MIEPTIAAAAIGAGSSLLSGIGNLIGGHTAFRRARDLQAQQAQYAQEAATTAYNRQRTLISEQNAYNDPMAARGRLENAGYNPFLTNLDGSGQQLQAGMSPMAAMPEAPYQAAGYGSNIGNDLASSFQQIMGALAQNRSSQADARLKDGMAVQQEMINNAKNEDGTPMALNQCIAAYQQSRVAENTAISLEIQNSISKMEQTFLSSTYHDEQGNTMPASEQGDGISDSDGNYTNYGFMQKNNLMKSVKEFDHIVAENAKVWAETSVADKSVDFMDKQMSKISAEIDNMKELLPYQKMQLKAQARELYSRIAVNQTQAESNRASTVLTYEQAATERGLRSGRVANLNADTANKNISAKVSRALFPYTVKFSKSNAEASGYEKDRSKLSLKSDQWRYDINYKSPWGLLGNGLLQPVSSFLGPAATIGSKFVK